MSLAQAPLLGGRDQIGNQWSANNCGRVRKKSSLSSRVSESCEEVGLTPGHSEVSQWDASSSPWFSDGGGSRGREQGPGVRWTLCATKRLFCAGDYARHFCKSSHLDLPKSWGVGIIIIRKHPNDNSKHNTCK